MRFSGGGKNCPLGFGPFVRHKIGIEHFVTTQRSDRPTSPGKNCARSVVSTMRC
jgi:hypothetical protein